MPTRQKIIDRFLKIWNLYTTIKFAESKESVGDAFIFLPIIGFCIGLFICLFSIGLSFLFGAWKASIVMIALFPLFLYFLNSGKHLGSLKELLRSLSREYFSEDSANIIVYMSLFMPITFLFKGIAGAFFIYTGNISWFIVISTIVSCVYAEVLILDGVIKVKKEHKRVHWIIALIVSIFVVGITGVVCVIACWFFLDRGYKFLKSNFDFFDEKVLYALCEASELIAIFIALLLLKK